MPQLVHARDIRKLDNTFSVFNEPSIEIRNQAILVSAGAETAPDWDFVATLTSRCRRPDPSRANARRLPRVRARSDRQRPHHATAQLSGDGTSRRGRAVRIQVCSRQS